MTLLAAPLLTSPHIVCADLLTVVAAELERCSPEPLTRVHVAAGAISWDDCCGMLVVAPERIFRTASFPIEGPDANGCFDGFIAIETLTLLLRCVPVFQDNGEPPTVAELEAAYSLLLNDAATIWNALESYSTWDSALLSQSFLGAEGGCIGVETRLTIGVEYETWCPCPAE